MRLATTQHLTILTTITAILAAFILASARHIGTDTVDIATLVGRTTMIHTAIEVQYFRDSHVALLSSNSVSGSKQLQKPKTEKKKRNIR